MSMHVYSWLASLSFNTTERNIPLDIEHVENIPTKDSSAPQASYTLSISKEGIDELQKHVNSSSSPTEKLLTNYDIRMDNYYYSHSRLGSEVTTVALEFQTKYAKSCAGGCCAYSASNLARSLSSTYAEIYDMIKQGYADGSREMYEYDPDDENANEYGYRRVTEDEELKELDEVFNHYAEGAKDRIIWHESYHKFLKNVANSKELCNQKMAERAKTALEKIKEKEIDRLNERVLAGQVNFTELMNQARERIKSQYSVGANVEDMVAMINRSFGFGVNY